MSEAVVTVEEAAARLGELVEQVHAQREGAVIVKEGRALARIVPIPAPGEVADDLIDFVRRWQIEHPEPDEGLAQSVAESRQGIQPPHDPWD